MSDGAAWEYKVATRLPVTDLETFLNGWAQDGWELDQLVHSGGGLIVVLSREVVG